MRPVGGLIGVMVEEEEDIPKVEASQLEVDVEPAVSPSAAQASTPAPGQAKQETPSPVAAALGTDEFFSEFDRLLHSGTTKVAPAAGWWMRLYMVLPTEVKATGPRGHVTKGDVLGHIEANKLVKG